MQLSDYIMGLGGLTAGDRLVANALLQPLLKGKEESHKIIDLAADLGMSIADVEASIEHLIAAEVIVFGTPPRGPYGITVDSLALICVATPAPDLFNQGERPSEIQRLRTGEDTLEIDGEKFPTTVEAHDEGFILRIFRTGVEAPIFAEIKPTKEECWDVADEWCKGPQPSAEGAVPLEQAAENLEEQKEAKGEPEKPASKPPKIPKPKNPGLVSQSVAAAESAPRSFPIMLTIGGVPYETTCTVDPQSKEVPAGAGGKPCTKFSYEPAANCPHASFTLYAFSDAVPTEGLFAWAAAFAQRQLDQEAAKPA